MKTLILLAGTLVTHILCATVPSQGPSYSGFSLEAKRENEQKRDFASDWAAAHGRWGSSATKKVSLGKSVLAEGEGTARAKSILHDQAYITEVDFGTPPQKLKVILDTGSSDVWVQSSDTIYRVNDHGPWAPRYEPNLSSTAQRIDKAVWGVRYLDGTTATGIVYRDAIRLGGFHVPNATIESAQIIAPRFETELSVSGILGLAKRLPNNINPPTPSFLSFLRPLLHRPVFTVDLRRDAYSRFDFGYINESILSDNITWLDSRSDSPHWDIDLDLTAWKGDHPTWMYHRFQATIDTGTSLMFLPDALASRYWLSVPGIQTSGSSSIAEAYMFPCSHARSLPDLLFKLPNTEHVLRVPGFYLNYGPIDSDPFFCWGGMQSAKDMDVTVLGDVMLKAIFVAFDVDKNRIGLANKKLGDV
ncbi:hypothetical protein E4U21_000551 [Claviceps maximensis]|nr:hypothetical protein E4U21_000551 [Claviceps maximensis]